MALMLCLAEGRRPIALPGDGYYRPRELAHAQPASGLRNRSFPAIEPLTPSRVSGSELGLCVVAGVGFEPA